MKVTWRQPKPDDRLALSKCCGDVMVLKVIRLKGADEDSGPKFGVCTGCGLMYDTTYLSARGEDASM